MTAFFSAGQISDIVNSDAVAVNSLWDAEKDRFKSLLPSGFGGGPSGETDISIQYAFASQLAYEAKPFGSNTGAGGASPTNEHDCRHATALDNKAVCVWTYWLGGRLNQYIGIGAYQPAFVGLRGGPLGANTHALMFYNPSDSGQNHMIIDPMYGYCIAGHNFGWSIGHFQMPSNYIAQPGGVLRFSTETAAAIAAFTNGTHSPYHVHYYWKYIQNFVGAWDPQGQGEGWPSPQGLV